MRDMRFFLCEPRQDGSVAAISIWKIVHFFLHTIKVSDFLGYSFLFLERSFFVYQALYRKWRPKVFDDVLGQEHITQTLKNQILTEKTSHAYLFSGSRGTGKTSTAKIFARAINCLNPEGANPCNKCSACKSALSGSAVDIIEMDAASNNKVEDTRTIIDEVVYTPAELRKKVYIIDEAHMLTQSAFNALLKTLEEPPSHILFIFATTEPHQFPSTILSRCQRFDFKRITPLDIEGRLRYVAKNEGFSISSEAISLISRISDGAMRDALSILDQCLSFGEKEIGIESVIKVTGVTDPEYVFDFVKLLIDGEISECYMKINDAYLSGRDLQKLPDEIINVFRNILVAKTVGNIDDIEKILSAGSYDAQKYLSLAEEISVERILRYIDIVSKSLTYQKTLHNPRLSLEMAVAGMAKSPDNISFDGIMERISELENKISSGTLKIVPKKEEAKKDVFLEKEVSIIPDEKKCEDKKVEKADEDEYEQPDYPTFSEEILVKNETHSEEFDLKSCFDDVIFKASVNAAPGFDEVLKNAKRIFIENGVEFYFTNEIFFQISKQQKFDECIKNAFLEVIKKDVTVQFIYKPDKEAFIKKDDSLFDTLADKLSE